MAWTIESALEADSVSSPKRLINEFRFQVGTLETTIIIRLYEIIGGDGVVWEQSHYIHTPTQGGKYDPGRKWGDYEAYALHLAVSSITEHYDQAVKEGHTPSESWLKPNKFFV